MKRLTLEISLADFRAIKKAKKKFGCKTNAETVRRIFALYFSDTDSTTKTEV